MAKRRRPPPGTTRSRRAARALQVQRDLLRFEGPFDEWATAELEVDPPLRLQHVLDELCAALVLMPKTPRPVTGFDRRDLIDLLAHLRREDGTGETEGHVAAALDVWAVFLLQTGRWSAGEDAGWDVREELQRVLAPPAPLLDEDRRVRLDAVMDHPGDDATLVTALDATRPVRQAARLLAWLSEHRVAGSDFGLDNETAETVARALRDPQVDTLRVLYLWYALRMARLVHVVDGHVRVTDRGWDGTSSGHAIESRSEVASAIWGHALVAGPDEDDVAKSVARVLVDLLVGPGLTEADVRVRCDDHDVAEEVLQRLHDLVADDAVRLDQQRFTVPAALRGTIGMMIDEAVLDRWDDALRDQ